MALATPVFYIESNFPNQATQVVPGIHCLLFGIFMIGHLGGQAWIANLLYASSMAAMILHQQKMSIRLVILALALAPLALLLKELPLNESGATRPITALGPGFYLWLSSMVTLALAALLSISGQGLRNASKL